MSDTCRDELDYILQSPLGDSPDLHLSSRGAVANYLRFADEIAARLLALDLAVRAERREARLLDWGCARGQMSWLLRRRGLDVVAYDLVDSRLPAFVEPAIPFVLAPDERRLPFAGASFDAVLSCGVLEHVADERASLGEIRRVLKPAGSFFVYQLPQVYAYTEWVNWLRGLWYHERRYTVRGIVRLLEEAGFVVVSRHRANLFLRNLTGLPPRLRDWYNRHSDGLLRAEPALLRVPGLNLMAHSLELIARKG